jgi:hypothetical protein
MFTIILLIFFMLPLEVIFSVFKGIKMQHFLNAVTVDSLEILSQAVRIHSPSLDIDGFFSFPFRVRSWVTP